MSAVDMSIWFAFTLISFQESSGNFSRRYWRMSTTTPHRLGEAIEVPLISSYPPPGTDERMLPPCAVISGLSLRSGEGPQLEKSDMNGPAALS